jgi:hypothetical protein
LPLEKNKQTENEFNGEIVGTIHYDEDSDEIIFEAKP